MRRRRSFRRALMPRYKQVLLKVLSWLVGRKLHFAVVSFNCRRLHFDNHAGLLCFFISFNNSSANAGSTSFSILYCAIASLYLPLPRYKVASSKRPIDIWSIGELSSKSLIVVLASPSQAIESAR